MGYEMETDQWPHWQCDECGCRSFALIHEMQPDGKFGPGKARRCVGCKNEFPSPDEQSRLEYLERELAARTTERDEARRYCSAAAHDYETLIALFESESGHPFEAAFRDAAKECRASSEFLRLAAEGRVNGTVYEDELTSTKVARDHLRAALDQIADTREYQDGVGLLQFKPTLSADMMQEIAFNALSSLPTVDPDTTKCDDKVVEATMDATDLLGALPPHLKFRRDAFLLAMNLDGSDFAGDVDPVDENSVEGLARTLSIVASAYEWSIDDEGRLFGLVAGDQGIASTSITVDTQTTSEASQLNQRLQTMREVLVEARNWIGQCGYNYPDHSAKVVSKIDDALSSIVETRDAVLMDAHGASAAITNKVRFSRARGRTLEQQRENLPEELYKLGDAIVVWANEGDLCLAGEEIK